MAEAFITLATLEHWEWCCRVEVEENHLALRVGPSLRGFHWAFGPMRLDRTEFYKSHGPTSKSQKAPLTSTRLCRYQSVLMMDCASDGGIRVAIAIAIAINASGRKFSDDQGKVRSTYFTSSDVPCPFAMHHGSSELMIGIGSIGYFDTI